MGEGEGTAERGGREREKIQGWLRGGGGREKQKEDRVGEGEGTAERGGEREREDTGVVKE